jgi:hypothetical protein
VDADPEHQQDDADLRELLREAEVGLEPRRERADRDAGEDIADEGGEPQPDRDMRKAAGSSPKSLAIISVSRSIICTASVTRKEQR